MKQIISTENQLGHLIQGLRKSQQLTQAQLAQKAGISQARLSVLELNPGRITIERLLRIMGALDLEMVIQEKADATPTYSIAQQPSEW
ncbi:MAG: helix-turn-helix domain-containing protein [Collimonas sp.]|uniref:helix-turn-helix domain-containing protein n=1 Tax=Collimonas sp. TaxID=1963772 RepID=UPI003262F8CB